MGTDLETKAPSRTRGAAIPYSKEVYLRAQRAYQAAHPENYSVAASFEDGLILSFLNINGQNSSTCFRESLRLLTDQIREASSFNESSSRTACLIKALKAHLKAGASPELAKILGERMEFENMIGVSFLDMMAIKIKNLLLIEEEVTIKIEPILLPDYLRTKIELVNRLGELGIIMERVNVVSFKLTKKRN